MNRLFVVSALGAALVLAMIVAVQYSAGGADRRRAAALVPTTPGTAAAKPLGAPKGDVVLRIKGVKRGNTKTAHLTALDFATLDRAASEEITIEEPFLKREMTFKGMRMGELLSRSGVDPAARNLYLHALDDYHVNLPIAGMRKDGFLAVRADGKPITLAKGGPVRLLFTGDGTLARNTDNWIWSFDSARVLR